ncbi:MAG: response regulator, partial [Cyclobacteriaceae bacterium]|nr:response regulator [Cyclobacteriaceae bacterium]
KLRKVDKLKDEFLANTSHELRTPLNGIIGISESLYEDFQHIDESKAKNNLAMVIASGKRLASLVNSILDFSKLKTHELKLSLKAIDLRTITHTVLHFCRPLVKDKSLKLINEIDPSSPLVEADEDRIYQILHNLIGNAIKFTSEGEIIISAIEVQDMVQVCVKDSGIGIPEDKIDDVFKSFEQIDASITREHGGTGLGLTITKQLIELHGGNIWIKSDIDQGSSVYFTLPKSAGNKTAIKKQEKLSKVISPVEEDDYESKLPSALSTPSMKSGFNILIVDDEPINQQVLSNHLARDDFRILQAMNGREALTLVENEKPDLILLDIMMPKMSGYEVCQEIRKKYLPSELPIIMITAKDQVPDLVEGLASGANDYLAKPFSKDELLARLKTHLNLYHINSAYLRFIPKEFLKALGHDSIIDVELGDQVQGDMTILFSDIRSFTSITEKLSAEESFEFLNEVLSSITPAITKNGGFIDKYIGDAIMALFPSNPEDAIISAIQVQENLSKYNKIRETRGKEKIKIGIGIHTGPLMLGTIGVKDRMDGTVISDAVNLASRLEGLNKLYGTSMIVSENTVKKLNCVDNYHYRFLSYARVKGKENAVRIYEFFDGDEDHDKTMKLKTLPTFNEGINEYYNQKFTRASVKFQDVIDSYPEDHTARLFLERSAQYMVQGVPELWDGVDIVEKVF